MLLYAAYDLRDSCTLWATTQSAGTWWCKILVILKPWLFQTLVYLETDNWPMTQLYDPKNIFIRCSVASCLNYNLKDTDFILNTEIKWKWFRMEPCVRVYIWTLQLDCKVKRGVGLDILGTNLKLVSVLCATFRADFCFSHKVVSRTSDRYF